MVTQDLTKKELRMFLLDYLYKDQRWSDYCIPLALVVTVITVSCSDAIGYLMTLIWLQFVVYLIHQTEEHFWPGGFRDFINTHMFKSNVPGQPLDDAIIFWINIPMIWFLFPLFAVLAQHVDLGYGSFLALFGAFNALLHIITGVRFRCYNPGLVVNIFLQMPSSLYTLYVMHSMHVLSNSMAYNMLALAIALHVAMVIMVMVHKLTTKKI